MSDYHILDTAEDGNSTRVVFHIPVPNGNNKAGVAWRTALSQWLGPQTSVIPSLGSEQALLTSGAVYEVVVMVDTNPADIATLKLRDRLDAMAFAMKQDVLARLGVQLEYWGFARNAP